MLRWQLIASVVGALLIAGCGGNGGDKGRARYIRSADRICRSAAAQAGPLVRKLTAVATGTLTRAGARAAAPDVERLHMIGTRYVERLDSLEQPSGDHAGVERFLRSTRQVVAALGRAGAALRRGDATSALAVLQDTVPVARDANAAARSYGMKQCASVLPL